MTRAQFKDLFDKHFDAVRNYIYFRSGDGEVATDIAQDTFLRIWEKQPSDLSQITGLLFKIANDEFISHYRRQKVMSKFKLNLRPDIAGRTPEEQMVYEELKDRYETALFNLPEKQRTVFLMSRIEQLKYHEIANRLGLSIKAVEKRMNQALVYLRQNLGES